MEFAAEQNNYQCDDKPSDWTSENSWIGVANDCLRNKGEDDCKVNMAREINFQYGRADCVSEYEGRNCIIVLILLMKTLR